MSDGERAEAARMLSALAVVFGESMPEARLEGYLSALSDVPLAALRAGIQLATRQSRFFPRPADLRAAVDSALRTETLASRYVTDEYDPRTLVNCSACNDTGWVFQGERPDGKANTVKRCVCYTTNPRLVREPTYGPAKAL